MSLPLLIALLAVLGLLIGSFLTVVVERVPEGGSVWGPPSRCGACGHRLGPLDLVPVISWLVLRGRCRHCGTAYGAEPLLIELATAALFVLFALEFEGDAVLPAFLVLGAALVAQSAIDLRHHRLPRQVTFTAIALGAPMLTIAALVDDEPERIWMAALGAAIAFALIGGVYWGAKAYYGSDEGFGFGDVILAPLLGMYLGWLNPGIVPVGLFFGFVIGALLGGVAMLLQRAGRQTALPFGPSLAAGTVVAVFAGQPFVDLVLAR